MVLGWVDFDLGVPPSCPQTLIKFEIQVNCQPNTVHKQMRHPVHLFLISHFRRIRRRSWCSSRPARASSTSASSSGGCSRVWSTSPPSTAKRPRGTKSSTHSEKNLNRVRGIYIKGPLHISYPHCTQNLKCKMFVCKCGVFLDPLPSFCSDVIYMEAPLLLMRRNQFSSPPSSSSSSIDRRSHLELTELISITEERRWRRWGRGGAPGCTCRTLSPVGRKTIQICSSCALELSTLSA